MEIVATLRGFLQGELIICTSPPADFKAGRTQPVSVFLFLPTALIQLELTKQYYQVIIIYIIKFSARSYY